MAVFGVWNDLTLLRWAPQGAYLDGGEHGEILLPANHAPAGCKPGQTLKVFVYLDAESRPTASIRAPLAQRGEVAHLKVVAVNQAGAFLAWGLPQDLFLPWKEVKSGQRRLVRAGQNLLVFLFTDEEGQVTASTRLEEFLSDEAEGVQEGDKVSLVIGDPTDLGVRVVVNHRYWGMVHNSDLFSRLTRGERREGYIKALRADHKLNVALNMPGYAKIDAIAQSVIETLKRRGGFLPVTDKSRPEEIYALFGISKKAFKQALGALYRAHRIVLAPDGIRMVGEK
jgi:predicted RNA-binding protein (virulence factor B family)